MVDKRKKPTAGQKYPRSGKPLNVWIDGPLRNALEALVAQSRRSLTTEVSIALEAHLNLAGLWPPPVPKPKECPHDPHPLPELSSRHGAGP